MIRTPVLALALSFAGMLSVGRSEEASPPWTVFADFEGGSFAPWAAEGSG